MKLLQSKNKFYLVLAIIVLVQFFFLTKLKFTAWPETLAWPYLSQNGWQFYRDIAIAHTPLMLFKLDIFYRIFGVGIVQLKVFTWALILALDALVFIVVLRLYNKKIATTSLAFFVIWQVFYEGNGLWFDLFMGVFAFVSFYFIQKKNWLLAGIFWGLALISKQTAVWFAIPIALEVIGTKRIIESAKNFMLGLLPVVSIFALFLFFKGTLPDFYNWAINFGILDLPRAQGQIQLPDLKNLSIAAFPFLVFLPLLFTKGSKKMLLLWAVAGMIGAYPRFEYFHFQPAIPFLAIGSALVFTGDWHKKELIKAFVPIYIIGSLYLFSGFLVRNYKEGTRFYEKNVQDVASYIKSNTSEGDKIFVMNWWDSIYALSETMPATKPLVPQLSWYQSISGVQEDELSGLKETKPKLIILNEYSAFGLASYKPQKVYDYVMTNYKLKEKIDGVQILIPR